jgi:hypothetical protein
MPHNGTFNDRIDAERLSGIINQCFDLSTDSSVSPDHQTEFLAAGKRLRGYLLNLITARFAQRTAELDAANRALQTATIALQADVKKVENMKAAINTLGRLVTALDSALKAASKFL